ncbi:MAG: prepilin-type N-terminal cleavage/methylation domain-containing protein [Thermoanaerobaculia bacterium]|nr:prepilin-type N-terminal cleavage/methylation domain-containing protein [Thermoanaerobaculia bacterium]
MMNQGLSRHFGVGRRYAHDRAGFSLIELILVVALLGILAAITVNAYIQWLPRMRLRGAAEETAVVMQRARLHAIRTNRPVKVMLHPSSDPATGQWLVAVPDGASPDAAVGRVAIPTPPNPTARVTVTTNFPSGELTYLGNGTIEAEGWFELADQKTPPNRLQVALDSVSGSQPKMRKFLLAEDAPGGTAGFFEQTLGSTNQNVWIWY